MLPLWVISIADGKINKLYLSNILKGIYLKYSCIVLLIALYSTNAYKKIVCISLLTGSCCHSLIYFLCIFFFLFWIKVVVSRKEDLKECNEDECGCYLRAAVAVAVMNVAGRLKLYKTYNHIPGWSMSSTYLEQIKELHHRGRSERSGERQRELQGKLFFLCWEHGGAIQ